MNKWNRRTFLGGIATLPFLSPLSNALQASSAEPAGKAGAVQAMRFLNTLQHWHRFDSGRFGSKADLLSSSALKRLIEDPAAEKDGIGKSLYSRLSFEGDEVVPGWGLRLLINENGDGYLITLKGNGGTGLSTDERAIIYEGKMHGFSSSPISAVAALDNPVPMEPAHVGRASVLRRLSALVGLLSFAPFQYDDTQPPLKKCTEFPCPCSCSCMESSGPICRNCGCVQCVWCCCPYY